MGERTIVALIVVTTMVVVFAALFALRRPVQRRIYAGTGLEEWRRTSRTLSRSDRWKLARANAKGRAAPRPLAPMAVQRGEAMSAVITRTLRKGSGFRKLWIAIGIVYLAGAALQIAAIVSEGTSVLRLLHVAPQLFLVLLWPLYPVLYRRQLRRIQQSVEENRNLLERVAD